jgi:4-hydroxy-3-polyprenylbenzoate decarboxylase
LQLVLPEVVDMNLPVEGGFHNLAIVSIRKAYPGHAKKVMNALWGLGHMMMLTRVLVVVDEDVDVQDARTVAWFVLNNLAADRDLVMMPGPVDDLDHGSYAVAYGTKIGIDATRKDAAEGYTREWPPEMIMDSSVRARVSERWPQYGLDAVANALCPDDWSGQGPAAYARLLAGPSLRPPEGGT